jgi:aspartate racemase
MEDNRPVLGILGGMGPLATVDFMRKVIELTPADRDQDHIPMTVVSLPQVPNRTKAILGDVESPLPIMLGGIELLNKACVACIAIPCNSAHYWYDELAEAADAPILHIADSAVSALDGRGLGARTVGVLGTSGVISAGIYQSRLDKRGIASIIPDAIEQEELVMGGIYQIKAGDLGRGRDLLYAAVAGLRKRGADALILGCTEIPIVVEDGDDIVDATLALARSCVEFLSQRRDV